MMGLIEPFVEPFTLRGFTKPLKKFGQFVET
jgi:hypothetical protein